MTFFHRNEKERCDGDVTAMNLPDSHVHIGKKCEKNPKVLIVSQRLFSGSAVFPTSSR